MKAANNFKGGSELSENSLGIWRKIARDNFKNRVRKSGNCFNFTSRGWALGQVWNMQVTSNKSSFVW